MEKSHKTRQGKKSLIPIIVGFWLLLSKFNFSKCDWALGYVSIQIWDFSNISLFPKSSVGRQLVYQVRLLDITFRFTCG